MGAEGVPGVPGGTPGEPGGTGFGAGSWLPPGGSFVQIPGRAVFGGGSTVPGGTGLGMGSGEDCGAGGTGDTLGNDGIRG
jgi:hypothetical protein